MDDTMVASRRAKRARLRPGESAVRLPGLSTFEVGGIVNRKSTMTRPHQRPDASQHAVRRVNMTCQGTQSDPISDDLNKANLNVVRQAHHERNQKVTVRGEPVLGLVQRCIN